MGPDIDDVKREKEKDLQNESPSSDEVLPESDDKNQEPGSGKASDMDPPKDRIDDDQDKNDKQKADTGSKRKKSGLGGKKKFYIVTVIILLIIIVCLAVYFVSSPDEKPVADVSKQNIPVSEEKALSEQPVKAEPESPSGLPKAKPVLQSGEKLTALMERAVVLRKELLEKADEVARLKKHYQNKIAQVEDEVLKEKKLKDISTFEHALGNTYVEFRLRTIQRRQAYIRELSVPARWLHNGSEALLYLTRKSEIEINMAPVARGIDLKELENELEKALEQYRIKEDSLTVNMDEVKLEPLEAVWKQILKKEALIARRIELDEAERMKDNLLVSKEICEGHFSNMALLTLISPDTAACLAKWKGSDMMVNHVTQMSPETAEHLFKWKGFWMSLNGLREVSPKTAKYMFRWKGDWLSLNGVSYFSPEAAKYISGWQGKQLELMGLQFGSEMGRIPTYLNFLALWEKRGGYLLVPDDIRERLDDMKK